MFAFLLWCLLFVMCWPLALLALIAYPFVWLDFCCVSASWASRSTACWRLYFWRLRYRSGCWPHRSEFRILSQRR